MIEANREDLVAAEDEDERLGTDVVKGEYFWTPHAHQITRRAARHCVTRVACPSPPGTAPLSVRREINNA